MGGEAGGAGATPPRNAHRPPPPRARRCRCLCVCRTWHAAGAGLPELWECVEAGWASNIGWLSSDPECTDPLLRWLDTWCATQQRPLRRLELDLYDLIIAPGVAAGLVAVLHRSATSLQHLRLDYDYRLWEQLVRGKRARKSGFLAAVAALQQLTSLKIVNDGAVSCRLPRSTVLPTSLQRLDYNCGKLPRQISQLTRLEHLTLDTPLPAGMPLPPNLRVLEMDYRDIPAQLANLTRLEELRLFGGGQGVSETDKYVTALARLTQVGVVCGAHCF